MVTQVSKEFGPEHGVINLSKLGFRYFRILLRVSPETKRKLSQELPLHPNVGWLFSCAGWFNLGMGFFAKNNSEINDLSTIIRKLLTEEDKIIYQSELTYLASFGNLEDQNSEMVIIDSKDQEFNFKPVEIDFLKLYTIDSSMSADEYAKILGISEKEFTKLQKNLINNDIILGAQKRLNYKGKYFKVFVDTSAINERQLEKFIKELHVDKNCLFYERANGKYDLEFEVVLENKEVLTEKYLKIFKQYKVAILKENLYTNLFPQSKVSNIKEIKDVFLQQKESMKYNLSNSKFWYLNYLGTKAYLSLYSSEKYRSKMHSPETSLFSKVIESFNTKHEKYNIIDLGSGDGTKAKQFITTLGKESVAAYYPVDIQTIEIAQVLEVHKDSDYPIHPTLLDFEKLNSRFPLRNNPNQRDIYMLLGGTYGNFTRKQINQYLRPLLEHSALLLVSMPIRDFTPKEVIINSYLSKPVENLSFGPLQQLGFQKEDFKPNNTNKDLKVQLEYVENSVRGYYISDKAIHIGDKLIKKDTRFDVVSSWKPTLEEFKKALESDFKIEKVISNQAFAFVLCSKK